MKQRLLSLVILLIANIPAQAQRVSGASIVRTAGHASLQEVAGSEVPQAAPVRSSNSRPLQAKAAGAAFYTQTFPSLPAGWTISANPNSVNGWRWANAAPVGTGNSFPINGLINSTTKGNGWLLYNADSVIANRSNATQPFGGSITSTAIPVGATHTNVMLSFQQYFRYSTGDSCFVDVSSNGTTWTSFPLSLNMKLSQFGFLYRNPTTTTLNISSVVGGQANAYIRFRFSSTAPTYSFNWLIDDLMLYDADPVDVGITYSGIVSASDTLSGFSTAYSYSSIPVKLTDSVYPITYISNYGLSAAANAVVTARYYNGGTLLSTQTMNIPASALGERDSAWAFGTGYKPSAAGNYIVALSVAAAGDATAQNDVDTVRFRVTDSVYASYGTEFTERNCYLSRPSNSTLAYWGARFTISNGQRDTITSVSAAFRPVTVAGERVQAQLYQATENSGVFSWTPLAVSFTRALTAADISTASNVVMTNFPLRINARNFGPLILGNGDYAVVFTTVTAANDVAVYSMVPPVPAAPAYIGYQGQSATSTNDGSADFAVGVNIATGLVEVPLVHPNFGNARALLSVSGTERIIVGAAFPNPANSSLHIPVGLQSSGRADLTLSNTVGQVVARKDLGQINAGTMQLASISTENLAEGIYFYTVSADGAKATGRVLIKH